MPVLKLKDSLSWTWLITMKILSNPRFSICIWTANFRILLLCRFWWLGLSCSAFQSPTSLSWKSRRRPIGPHRLSSHWPLWIKYRNFSLKTYAPAIFLLLPLRLDLPRGLSCWPGLSLAQQEELFLLFGESTLLDYRMRLYRWGSRSGL